MIVVGTRPEVIKMSPLAEALRRAGHVSVSVCVVAQQGALLDQALADAQLGACHRVDLPAGNRQLTATLAAMLPLLSGCMERERPSIVAVEGDTTTNLAAALAAFYAHIPVAHVEAGLRSGDLEHPFPEEMHRLLVDRLAAIHYAPTEGARQNLMAEGQCRGDGVIVAGNTVVDALLAACSVPGPLPVEISPLRRFLLVTAHRRESFGAGIESICHAVGDLVNGRRDLQAVFVLHSNPAARQPVEAALGRMAGVQLIEPQPYHTFIRLLAAADIVLTDSGGVQEEAPYLGTPVLVTRQVTERPEASEMGAAMIVGTDRDAIVDAVSALLDDAELYSRMSRRFTPYGDGHAAQRICDDLERRLLQIEEPAGEGQAACRTGPQSLFGALARCPS